MLFSYFIKKTSNKHPPAKKNKKKHNNKNVNVFYDFFDLYINIPIQVTLIFIQTII